VLANQPIDGDITSLADTVASILGLPVHRWIPIGIVENDVACSGKVEPDSSRPRRTDKAEHSWIVVEALY